MSAESVKFHIESGDYFGTLATVLDLVKQQSFDDKDTEEKNILERMVAELIYLQNNYKITEK